MGLKLFSSGPDPVTWNPNPNPRRAKVVEQHHVGDFTVAVVKYDGCTNFEGNKVLVYNGYQDLRYWQEIDPHFYEGGINPRPFARFEPTNEGVAAAVTLAFALSTPTAINAGTQG